MLAETPTYKCSMIPSQRGARSTSWTRQKFSNDWLKALTVTGHPRMQLGVGRAERPQILEKGRLVAGPHLAVAMLLGHVLGHRQPHLELRDPCPRPAASAAGERLDREPEGHLAAAELRPVGAGRGHPQEVRVRPKVVPPLDQLKRPLEARPAATSSHVNGGRALPVAAVSTLGIAMPVVSSPYSHDP